MDNEIKNNIAESSSVEANDNFELQNISKLGGTNNDEHDMAMLGRTQVLNVRDSKNLKVLEVDHSR
jgi:choline transport protein